MEQNFKTFIDFKMHEEKYNNDVHNNILRRKKTFGATVSNC